MAASEREVPIPIIQRPSPESSSSISPIPSPEPEAIPSPVELDASHTPLLPPPPYSYDDPSPHPSPRASPFLSPRSPRPHSQTLPSRYHRHRPRLQHPEIPLVAFDNPPTSPARSFTPILHQLQSPRLPRDGETPSIYIPSGAPATPQYYASPFASPRPRSVTAPPTPGSPLLQYHHNQYVSPYGSPIPPHSPYHNRDPIELRGEAPPPPYHAPMPCPRPHRPADLPEVEWTLTMNAEREARRKRIKSCARMMLVALVIGIISAAVGLLVWIVWVLAGGLKL